MNPIMRYNLSAETQYLSNLVLPDLCAVESCCTRLCRPTRRWFRIAHQSLSTKLFLIRTCLGDLRVLHGLRRIVGVWCCSRRLHCSRGTPHHCSISKKPRCCWPAFRCVSREIVIQNCTAWFFCPFGPTCASLEE